MVRKAAEEKVGKRMVVDGYDGSVFDRMASEYDDVFSNAWVGKAQRSIVHRYLAKNGFLIQDKSCLEINCGTGVDALYLSQKGVAVTASDGSLEMVRVTQTKLESNGVVGSKVVHCRFEQIEEQFGDERFDFVLSNFGGLNCINPNELRALSKSIAHVLKPGGRFVAVIMPKWCIWESFYFLLSLRWHKVFRRKKDEGVVFKQNDYEVQTYYYSPSGLKSLMYEDFEIVSQTPIGVTIPPSYLSSKLSCLKFLLVKAEGLRWLQKKWPAGIADHFLIDLCKK